MSSTGSTTQMKGLGDLVIHGVQPVMPRLKWWYFGEVPAVKVRFSTTNPGRGEQALAPVPAGSTPGATNCRWPVKLHAYRRVRCLVHLYLLWVWVCGWL